MDRMDVFYVNTAMQMVPQVRRIKPIHALTESFSRKTIRENTTVTNMLNLSIGITTLSCPC